jgi:hypothetical protein
VFGSSLLGYEELILTDFSLRVARFFGFLEKGSKMYRKMNNVS